MRLDERDSSKRSDLAAESVTVPTPAGSSWDGPPFESLISPGSELMSDLGKLQQGPGPGPPARRARAGRLTA